MFLLLILVVCLVLFGGLGFGYHNYAASGGFGANPIMLIVIVVILLCVFGGGFGFYGGYWR